MKKVSTSPVLLFLLRLCCRGYCQLIAERLGLVPYCGVALWGVDHVPRGMNWSGN